MEEWQVTPFLMHIFIVIELQQFHLSIYLSRLFFHLKLGYFRWLETGKAVGWEFVEKCLLVFLWVCKVYLTIITRARARE